MFRFYFVAQLSVKIKILRNTRINNNMYKCETKPDK